MQTALLTALSIALCGELIYIAVYDWRTYRIANQSVFLVAIISVSIVILTGHIGLDGVIGAFALSSLAMTLGALRWWGMGDAKLMSALSIMMVSQTRLLNVVGGVDVFLILTVLGLATLAIARQIKVLSYSKPPGAVALVLPGIAFCLLSIASVR
ncbi:prepilin peptidase [Ferrimicrobium acidiphilum]|jgi:Flp pilus assembly protein protease CpaA|uniref:prepilin peptidase n=1 Tax=Ferrimicrobium acidiphilum TaxID=121039 RepID=UPI0023F194F9|nr:prepilin peptidase [Ferrimicrobium acidiphilum]